MDILQNWIDERNLNSDLIEELRGKFEMAEPFEHLHIENFLKEEKANLLREALLEENFVYKENDLFSLSQTADLSECKNEVLKSFYLFLSSKEFSEFMKRITGIDVVSGALDVAGSLYRSGDYLLCHDDLIDDRRIAYLFYLCVNFEEKDGGRFLLFSEKGGKPWKAVKAQIPKWNSFMLFRVSRKSFHAVEENFSDKERLAIGGWLH